MLLSGQALFCFHQLAVRKDRRADHSRNHGNTNAVTAETAIASGRSVERSKADSV